MLEHGEIEVLTNKKRPSVYEYFVEALELPSDEGLDNGRIVKLKLITGKRTVAEYDRQWIEKPNPKDTEAEVCINKLLKTYSVGGTYHTLQYENDKIWLNTDGTDSEQNIVPPLAVRMRPRTIDEIVGQDQITYENSLLWNLVRNNVLSSILLYGPPGTGKTSIANVIANSVNAQFVRINAVAAGKKDIEDAVEFAKTNLRKGVRTVLFIDEIHRFNKIQQDYLLPFVEDGTVILIGATTENPSFEVLPALRSRSQLFELKPVSIEAVEDLLRKTMTDERGLKDCGKTVPDDVINLIAVQSGGDVRHALTLLETACGVAEADTVTIDDVKNIIQKPNLDYDKDGNMHYDTISAFIKSMRGSDPDAVLYYLARMIHSGEDPKFIARRIMIHASEDVGNADPMAIVVATSASLAAERIGWPESQIILSQAALYVAMAPKSNTSCAGIGNAMEYVAEHPSTDIPNPLRDAHYKTAKLYGHGIGYVYPHDYPYHWIPQQYLPDAVKDQQFYHNSHMGYEQTQADYQNNVHNQTIEYLNKKEQ